VTPPRTSSLTRASSLANGACGLVASVEGPVGTVERLAALGLVPGVALRVIQSGSPMTVAVGETRLALGAAWADALVVVPT
jgi:Fe2+ transport system protein FeoA